MTDIKKGLEPDALTDLDLVAHSQALSLKRIADSLEQIVSTSQIKDAVNQLQRQLLDSEALASRPAKLTTEEIAAWYAPVDLTDLFTEPLNEAEFNRPFVVREEADHLFSDGATDAALDRTADFDTGEIRRAFGKRTPATREFLQEVLFPDGWIDWNGQGLCPVGPDVRVQVLMRGGHTTGQIAKRLIWSRLQGETPSDIVAYRVIE